MKNNIIKTCLTAATLSVTGLANAQAADVKIFTQDLMSHAAISGGALSITADSGVDGDLAAQAAVSIGAGKGSHTQNIYAGAAVNTGADSTAENIISGAATGVGAGAHVASIQAGAAIVVGALAEVMYIHPDYVVTEGAGSLVYRYRQHPNEALSTADIKNTAEMAAAITQIRDAQAALSSLQTTGGELYMNGENISPNIYSGAALTIGAGSVVKFIADKNSATSKDHVWVVNLTGALTVGAGTQFEVDVPKGHTATIIWNVGGAVTLGAGTEFIGTAFVNGAFTAATSNVSCGNIYAIGAVSVGNISSATAADSHCGAQASGLADLMVEGGVISLPAQLCPLWTASELAALPYTAPEGVTYYVDGYSHSSQGRGNSEYTDRSMRIYLFGGSQGWIHMAVELEYMKYENSGNGSKEFHINAAYIVTYEGEERYVKDIGHLEEEGRPFMQWSFKDQEIALDACDDILTAEMAKRGIKEY